MQQPLNTSYPVLPLRDIVVFPHMIVPLFVGREKSVHALEEVMADDKQILLAAQIDPAVDDPDSDGIYKTGVLANVLQLLKLPDGTVKVLVEGQARVKITEYLENERFFEAKAEYLSEMPGDPAAITALVRTVGEEFERYAKSRRTSPKRRSLRSRKPPIRPSSPTSSRAISALRWNRSRSFWKPCRSASGSRKSTA